jgi:hypothetical protein
MIYKGRNLLNGEPIDQQVLNYSGYLHNTSKQNGTGSLLLTDMVLLYIYAIPDFSYFSAIQFVSFDVRCLLAFHTSCRRY